MKYQGCYNVWSDYAGTMTSSKLQIPELINILRKRMNLSQEKFAARLGVSFQTVNRWEKGRATPSPMAMTLIELQLRQMRERGADLMSGLF
ncbi:MULTISPECIES: helix-turn-helix domain-containing protein [unclassified Limnospira]|uniref:helix-turn-helix domain-containing protein n=2 Tax=unclassified Limnospira TaxID=2642885 RepID=UPI0028E610BB|nr:MULTISPECIES: helix-turn-helix domain-containing protein [unclassified Limnospira]